MSEKTSVGLSVEHVAVITQPQVKLLLLSAVISYSCPIEQK